MATCPQAATYLQTAVQSSLQECAEYSHVLWDDIIVLAPDEETMLERLAIVFGNLSASGFLMKRHKLALFVGASHPEIQLFGMSVNLQTKVLRPLEDKVKEILERATPRTQTEMKSLLGALNWQSSFLLDSAPHHAILHKMTHKNCNFVYTEERLRALEFFIDALVSPECFNHLPTPDLPFDIHTDACDYSGGMVLSQTEPSGRIRVISYMSRVFSERQIRLSTFEKESITSLMALEGFWNFIEGKPTKLYTDSKNSAYITIFSKTNSKVGRYRLFLESLDFLTVVWVPAEAPGLMMADMLSRRSLHPKQCLNKQVKPEDTEKVNRVTQKLKNRFQYTIAQAHYLLDFAVDLSEEELHRIPNDSLHMNEHGEICIDYDGELTNLERMWEQERKHESEKAEALRVEKESTNMQAQDTGDVTLSEATHGRGLQTEVQAQDAGDVTLSEVTHDRGLQTEVEDKEGLNQTSQPLPLPESQPTPNQILSRDAEIPVENQEVHKGGQEPVHPEGAPVVLQAITRRQSAEANKHKPTNPSQGGDHTSKKGSPHMKVDPHAQTKNPSKALEDTRRGLPEPTPSFGEMVEATLDKDSLDETVFQSIHFEESEKLKPPPDSRPPQNAPRDEKFLYCIQQSSPFLSFQSLREAQEKDDIFGPLIKKCEESPNGLYRHSQRLNYFTAGRHHVLCREVADQRLETCRIQLCVSKAHAFDFCMMAHRGSPGSALTSRSPPTHFNPKKLCRLLSQKFYIHKLSDVLEYIAQSCQICVEAKPHRRNRRDYIKKTIKITRAGQCWYVDYLTVSSHDNVWGYKDLLIFTDAYSGYTVAAPVLKPTTQAYFIELLFTHVIQYFAKPQAIYSDNASNLSGRLVREAATCLNICHNTTNKHQPRASGAELSNKHILAGMRTGKEAYTLPPNQWCFLLSNALININFTPYQNSETFTSPAVRFFGNSSLAQNPQYYGSFITEATEHYESENALLRGVKKADDILATLRQQHNAKRWESEQEGEPLFSPGDIVLARYRPRPGKEFAHKLTRRYKFKFSVVYCRGTTCWIRPWSQGSIEKWAAAVDMSRRSRESNLVLPTYKIDAANLVKINHGIHLYNSNQRKLHYSEFAMKQPEECNMEVLEPVQPAPNMFAPERDQDTYSEYEDPQHSFGPNYDGEDEDEDKMFCETDMEEQLESRGQNVYFYDSDDELRIRGSRKGKRKALNKVTVGDGDCVSNQETIDLGHQRDQRGNIQPSSREAMRRKPILKHSTGTPIGEKLAQLAGYTLRNTDTTRTQKESTTMVANQSKATTTTQPKQVRFDNTVIRLDWRGRIEEDIRDLGRRPIRKLGNTGVINDILAAGINTLDAQLLPPEIWSSNDVEGCRCKSCNVCENNPCKAAICPECSFQPPSLWK